MLGFFKWVILVGILFICTSIGRLKAKSYQNRVEALKKLKSSLEMLKSKIDFTYEPIQEIFKEISKIVYANEENIFEKTLQQMKQHSVAESWNIAVEENIDLNQEDKATIKMFGKLLGKTDKAGQINEINVTSELLRAFDRKSGTRKREKL